MEKINLYLPKPQLKRLRADAKREGISMAEVIRQIIATHYVNREIDGNRKAR